MWHACHLGLSQKGEVVSQKTAIRVFLCAIGAGANGMVLAMYGWVAWGLTMVCAFAYALDEVVKEEM